MTLQDEHHGVVLADAEALQIAGGLVALLLQLGKRRADFFALVVRPQQGQTVGFLLCPGIHHVVGKIEVLWNDKLQVLIVILDRRKRRLF